MENIAENAKIILENIFFDYSKSEINEESKAELMRIVEFMKNNSTFVVEISGHTDNIGKYEDNLKLSQERADSVVQFIINQGIEKERLVSVGYSYNQPIADNNTKEGRALNRRVEFKIINL